MSAFSDETLMAYIDGELPDAERIAVERAAETSIDIRQRINVFRATGRNLGALFAQPMHEPPPQRLLDAIYRPSSPASIITRPASVRNGRLRHAASRWPIARAAGIALLAIGVSAYWYGQQSSIAPSHAIGTETAADGRRIAAKSVAAILDHAVSGAAHPASVGEATVIVKPMLSFASADRSYCRQYNLAIPDERSFVGVACRGQNGDWRIEAFAQTAERMASPGAIAPAAGPSQSQSIEATIDRLIVGDALSREAERQAIERGWQPPNKE